MSTLWTPGGEVPIDRNTRAEPGPAPQQEQPPGPPGPQGQGPEGQGREAAGAGAPGTEADYERMRRQMLEVPAADVVAQHAVAIYELAALHLSEPEPRLSEARLAIDALTALVKGLEGRLGQAEDALAEALPQLKMAFVEATDRER